MIDAKMVVFLSSGRGGGGSGLGETQSSCKVQQDINCIIWQIIIK